MREAVLALLLATGIGGAESPTSKATGGDDCAGILPDPLPPSRSIITPHEEGQVCGYVTVDGDGNVASLGGGYWTVASRDGDIVGSFSVGSDVMPQPSGFQGLLSMRCGDMPCFYLFHFNPDGTERRRAYLGPGDACGGRIGRIVGGGSEVTRYCGSQISLVIFDSDGSPVSAGVVLAGFASVRAAVDLNELSLVVYTDGRYFGYGRNDYVGRWYDGAVNPISDYFLILTADDSLPIPTLRPIIGGGIAVQLYGQWVAMSPGGIAESAPAPDWLVPYSNYDIEIVRGGRAHALIPKYPIVDRSTIPLYSASGQHCGDVTFPLPNVTVGMDGTAISSTGDDACTTTWWPQVLP